MVKVSFHSPKIEIKSWGGWIDIGGVSHPVWTPPNIRRVRLIEFGDDDFRRKKDKWDTFITEWNHTLDKDGGWLYVPMVNDIEITGTYTDSIEALFESYLEDDF